jgi:16S rRNA (uracil1498-N3)-methyltransferase
MHRFFLRSESCAANELVLEDEEAHHASDVLRLRPGTIVTVLNGAGGEWTCAIRECNRRQVRLEVQQARQAPPPRFRITLFQAITKGKAMEWLLQKATELGAYRIVPVLAEHTVPHLDDKREDKRRKWETIVREALKQCGNPWLPIVDLPGTLQDCLRHSQGIDLALLAALRPNASDLNHWLADYQTRQQRPPSSIGLWIGPEGDFTAAESDMILSSGAQPVTLGPWILRSETAALFGLSILNHELDNRFRHSPKGQSYNFEFYGKRGC